MTDTDPQITPLELAQALDAAIDAADAALDSGDTADAAALLDGLAVTSDALLAALGAPEPDSPPPPDGPPPGPASIADIPTV